MRLQKEISKLCRKLTEQNGNKYTMRLLRASNEIQIVNQRDEMEFWGSPANVRNQIQIELTMAEIPMAKE